MSDSNVTCRLYAPQTQPCGAFGTCKEVLPQQFTCECKPGYSAIGDFSVWDDNPCDINILAVRILWAFTLLGIIVAVFMSIWGLMARRAARILQWKAWRLWIVPYLVLLQSSVLLAMTIGKLVDPIGFSVGVNVAMTIMHGFTTVSSVTFLVVGLAGISKTALSGNVSGRSTEGASKMKVDMKRLEVSIAIFWFISAFCGFAPYFILGNKDNLFWSTALHGCGFAFGMLVLGSIVAPRQLSLVIKSLTESKGLNSTNMVNKKKIQIVLQKLKYARVMAGIGFTFAAVCTLLISVWPFLVVKAAYSLPLLYVLAQMSAAALIWVTTTTNVLVMRRPSMALKRLSQAFSSAALPRKSMDNRSSISDRRTSYEKQILPIVPSAGDSSVASPPMD